MSKPPPPSNNNTNGNSANCLNLAEMNIQQVQSLLDDHLLELKHPWKGSIPFKFWPVEDKTKVSSQMFDAPPLDGDLCDYLNGQQRQVKRLYLSPLLYPPPKTNDDMKIFITKDGKKSCNCQGWIDLKRDIETSALDKGNPVISNGSNGASNLNRVFKCPSCGRSSRNSTAMAVTDDNPFRETSLVNDRQNNRKGGKTGPKKMRTSKPTNNGVGANPLLCNFSATIKWDEFAFFVELERNAGNPMHEHHPRIVDSSAMPFPTRLLTQEQIEDTRDVVRATSNRAVGRNFLKGRLGRFVDSVKIAYLGLREDKTDTADDITNMIDNFITSEEIAFTCISDVPISDLEDGNSSDKVVDPNETVTIITKKSSTGHVTNNDALTLPSLKPIETEAKKERKERSMTPADVLFIGIGWIVIPAFRFFMLCPEVIWCDVTSHSNNKGFHLFSFSCRLSIGKQVVFMWVWIPNQQRFSFRWVFQHAIPNLMPKWLRDRVRFIMKDGDPQQRNEIIYSFDRIFVNAIEGTCGMHIGEYRLLLLLILDMFLQYYSSYFLQCLSFVFIWVINSQVWMAESCSRNHHNHEEESA